MKSDFLKFTCVAALAIAVVAASVLVEAEALGLVTLAALAVVMGIDVLGHRAVADATAGRLREAVQEQDRLRDQLDAERRANARLLARLEHAERHLSQLSATVKQDYS